MTRYLEIDSWPRRHHFEFFKDYEQPFFNLCSRVDVTHLYEATRRDESLSFFLSMMYLTLKAANEIEAFHYRLEGDQIVVHEVVHGGSTILRQDETFGFAYFEYCPALTEFLDKNASRVEAARNASGPLEHDPDRRHMIYYSVIPWVEFTSFSHARKCPAGESIPRIVFGKHHPKEEHRVMPISVEVHHALVDGLDVGRYLELLQKSLDEFNPGTG